MKAIERIGLWRRNESGLAPLNGMARSAWQHLAPGEKCWLTVNRSRSAQQHRLFFALLTLVAEASEFETPERLLNWIKIRLGRYHLVQLPKTEQPVILTDSISFSRMDQDAFDRFFREACAVIFCDILPHVPEAGVLAEAQSMLGDDFNADAQKQSIHAI